MDKQTKHASTHDRAPSLTTPSEPAVPALRPDAPAPHPVAMRKRRWLWAGIGALVIGLGVAGYLQPWANKTTSVVVETATLAPVTRVLAVNGRIAPVHSVDIRPLVGGKIDSLLVEEGDVVKPGQILAQIDAKTQNAVIRQAMAGLDAALVAKEQARVSYERSLALGGNVARSVLENEARALQSAENEVARMTALLDQAQIVLQNHTISAPIAGSVVVLNVDPGQIVDPATLVLSLADLNDPVVETDVDEAYARQIALDQPAVLQLVGETATRAGHVSYVAPRVDVTTGGLAVKVAFDTPVTAPLGLTVATNIIVDQRDAALTVPRSAIVTGTTGSSVFVVTDGTAHLRPIETVEWPAARLIVTKGLAAGDEVIVDAQGLKDGQAVTAEQP
ncbi:efflux RND transporter periplasmic adaptor subunit [Thioclava indica]|uniref:efflux RND transporter periplasmic adaptor subunit n=1 Tax=Thioclava indica TaxID=1353528 RepID=UPI001F0B09F6|nr:efflux RND transporter periplasmic adaptor subunit [Thioclava indica]